MLLACEGNDAVHESKTDSGTFKTFKVTVEAPEVSLSKLVESIEVMGLEETESSLLAYANNISSYQDRYIFPSGSDGEIFTYSNTGKFISKFSRKGDGPGEYSSLKALWMKEDSLVVFDHNKKRLMYYDLSGEHLKTVSFNEQVTHALTYGNDFLMEVSFRSIKDSLNYRLLVQNQAMEDIAMHIPYEKSLPFPVYSSVSSFKPYDDHILFQPTFHDTIYMIKGGTVEPYYNIDFGDDYFWDDESLYDNPNDVMGEVGKRNQVWIFNSYATEKHILINFNTSFRDFYQGIINRETGDYQLFDLKNAQEERLLLIMNRPDGDRFLFNMPSTDLANFIKEAGEDKVQFRADWNLEKIESSENPVLLWVKFK